MSFSLESRVSVRATFQFWRSKKRSKIARIHNPRVILAKPTTLNPYISVFFIGNTWKILRFIYSPSHDRWNPKWKNNRFQFLWSGRKDVDVGESWSTIGSGIELLRKSSRSVHVIEIWKDFFHLTFYLLWLSLYVSYQYIPFARSDWSFFHL